MLTKEQARESIEIAVEYALEAGLTTHEIKDEFEYVIKNYEDES